MYSVKHEDERLREWPERMTREILERRASQVSLHENRIAILAPVERLTIVASVLTSLDLSNNLLTDTGADALTLLTRLATLNLHNNALEQAPFLSALSSLTQLDLSANRLVSLELHLGEPSVMIHLNLALNRRTPTTLPYAMLMRMPRLSSLNLANNMITLAANDPIAASLPLASLYDLRLDGASLLGFTECDFLRTATTRLWYLRLNDCVDLCVVPPAISQLTQLRILELARCTALNTLVVYPQVHAQSLRTLVVADCDLRTVDERLTELTNLRKLVLHGNKHMHTLPANMASLVQLKSLSLDATGWQAAFFAQGMRLVAAQQQRLERSDTPPPPPPAIVTLTNLRVLRAVLDKWSAWFSGMAALEQLPLLRIPDVRLLFQRQRQREQWHDANLLEVRFGALGAIFVPRNNALQVSPTLASLPWDELADFGSPPQALLDAAGQLPSDWLYYSVSDLLYGYVHVESELRIARLFVTSAYWRKSAARMLLKVWLASALGLVHAGSGNVASAFEVLVRLFVHWVMHSLDEVDDFPNPSVYEMLRHDGDIQRVHVNLHQMYALLSGWFGSDV